jgi:hypothetical protein
MLLNEISSTHDNLRYSDFAVQAGKPMAVNSDKITRPALITQSGVFIDLYKVFTTVAVSVLWLVQKKLKISLLLLSNTSAH